MNIDKLFERWVAHAGTSFQYDAPAIDPWTFTGEDRPGLASFFSSHRLTE